MVQYDRRGRIDSKKEQKSAYAMTCTLLTNKEGKKMGKTAKGALWLDPEKQVLMNFISIGEMWTMPMWKNVYPC